MSLAPLSATAAEITHFRTFGFVRLRGAHDDVLTTVTEAFEDVLSRPAQDRSGDSVSCVAERSDVLREVLLADHRCPRLARQLLGTDVVHAGGDGVRGEAAAGWHRDGGHRALRLLRIVQYLDPQHGPTGALRIIPGTHRRGGSWDTFAAEMDDPLRLLGMDPIDVPAFTVTSSPGDLVAFDPHCYHASFGAGTGRRITTTYASAPESDEARRELSGHLLAARPGPRESGGLPALT